MRLIYVHGINTLQAKDTLKKEWDKALFGSGCNDKKACTRVAYWAKPPKKLARMLGSGSNKFEEKIKKQILNNIRKNDTVYKIFPTPYLRDKILRLATEWLSILADVKKFLYDRNERQRMCKALEVELSDALNNNEKIMIIAHSQGSMIAYDVISKNKNIPIELFITIGSPLGLEEIKDRFKKWYKTKKLNVPVNIERWVNVANRFDYVALDAYLCDDFVPEYFIQDIKERWLGDLGELHSATIYLSSRIVRKEINLAWH